MLNKEINKQAHTMSYQFYLSSKYITTYHKCSTTHCEHELKCPPATADVVIPYKVNFISLGFL